MLRFIARRVVWMFPVLLVILAAVFLLMHAIPGGPWDSDGIEKRAMNTVMMDPISKKALYQRYGLDDPLWLQFTGYLIGRKDPASGTFICGLVCGNMGPSYHARGMTVQEILFKPMEGNNLFTSRFAYSLRLSSYAFLLALLVGLPLGVLAAVRAGTWADYAIKSFATLLISVPNFVLGLILLIVLSGNLHLIVVAPIEWNTLDPRVWATPVIILSVGVMAGLIRLTRAALLEMLRRDYVRTARAKGLREELVVYRHMLKNALIPIVTFSGPALLELFAGSFVVEVMFSYPGMGRQYIEAARTLDYAMILGVTLVYALMIALVNLVVDLLYGAIDPRIRAEV